MSDATFNSTQTPLTKLIYVPEVTFDGTNTSLETTLYTVPTGKNAILIQCIQRLVSVSGYVSGGIFSITNPTDPMIDSAGLNLAIAGYAQVNNSSGTQPIATSGQVIKHELVNGINAASASVAVSLLLLVF